MWPSSTPSYCTISGDAGDGARHFSVSGETQITGGGSFNNLRIGYVNFGTVNNPGANQALIYLGTGNNLEIDHNFAYLTGAVDAGFHVDAFTGNGYDQNQIHDNILYTPTTSGNPSIGADGFVMSGSGASGGFTISNNVIISYRVSNYALGQHSDGWQTSGGSYIKIVNNLILGFGDISIYGGCWGNAVSGGNHCFNNVRYLNNIVDSIDNTPAGAINVAADQAAGSYFTNIWIFNNIARSGPTASAQPIQWASGDRSGTWTGNACSNNICICPSGTAGVRYDYSIPNGNNVKFTDAQCTSLFVSYVASGTNNNFHLTASASSLIGQGANLYSAFTYDKEDHSRPSSGAWDIGPYAYGSSGGGGNTNPVVLVSPASLDFGTVLTGLGTNLTLTVQNTGGGTLTGSASVTAPFQIISGGTYNLGSNQTQTVTVKFNPTAAGTYNQAINFTGGNGTSANLTGVAYAVLPGLSFDADAGVILAPFTVTASGLVPSGSYVSQASTTGLAGSGEAVYAFNITSAGSYAISALVNAPNSAANSFYVNIDGQPTDPTMIWDPPVTSGFTNLVVSWRGTGTDTNNQFAPIVFNLSAGTHQLIVRGREGGGQLASMSLIPYAVPPAPTGLHVLSP